MHWSGSGCSALSWELHLGSSAGFSLVALDVHWVFVGVAEFCGVIFTGWPWKDN